jgi:enterochelin esterase family protein
MKETIHRFRSAHLGNERSLWIREPREETKPCRLVIFLDAELYRDRVGAVSLIDELEAISAIANAFYVFVSMESVDARWRECPCYPPFADCINEELLPWLEERHPAIKAAEERVLVGLSYTGLAAAYVALRAEGRFHKVVAQSGSFWSNDGWLVEQYRKRETREPIEFYLDVGMQETAENVRHREDVVQRVSQIVAVRRFRDVLMARGYGVLYRECDGGNDFAAWRQTLPDALRWALPRESFPG